MDELDAAMEILSQGPQLAIDTEFIREKTFFPQIALIQLANHEQTWLLDPLEFNRDSLTSFLDLMRNPKVLKVMHAAFADQEVLYWSYGVTAEPMLDTSVAAALVGLGDSVGLGTLTRDVLGIKLPKGLARAKWLSRPISPELVEYAAMDVAHLLALSDALCEKLKTKDRMQWALEASVVPEAAFDTPPEDIAKKISKSGHLDGKTCAVLLELVKWREARAKDVDLPRNWVSDNETLRAIAKVKPKSRQELSQFRGLNKREYQKEGDTILDCIRRGLSQPPLDWKRGPGLPIPSDDDNRATDLLKAYVNYLCTEHSIAPRFVLSGNRFYRLLLSANESPDVWVEKDILSENACRLLSKDLVSFLHGKRGLSLEGKKVKVLGMED